MLKMKYIVATILILMASIVPDLIFATADLYLYKIAALLVMTILCLIVRKLRELWKLGAVLLVINGSFWMSALIRHAAWWQGLFAGAGFFRDVAANVWIKLIGIIPVAAILLILLQDPARCYLMPGYLSVKADAIAWLGIPRARFRWGRLAVVSGILIMSGTILLAMLTSTGFRLTHGLAEYLQNLPLILLLALINSFCEGLVFRSAIIGPIRGIFPKFFVTILPALFFGIAHYQGIPGGLVGAVMSGILGWYMSRSLYETNGFAAAWIIHFLQDTAIFSTMILLG